MLIRPGQRMDVATSGLLISHLQRWGYATDVPAHVPHYGKRLQHEVKRFQAQHPPLTVDGVVGPQTWTVLRRPRSDDQRLGLGQVPADSRIPLAPGTAVADLLAAALADYDAGRRETPLGYNRCPWLEPRAQGKPWCSFQVHAWIRSVRGTWIFGGRRGSTRMDLRIATERGLVVTDPRPGDVFLLCDDTGRPYHTGLVLRVQARMLQEPGTPTWYAFNTVEGNVANRVAIREREERHPEIGASGQMQMAGTRTVFWRPFPGELDWAPGLLPNVKRAGGESTR